MFFGVCLFVNWITPNITNGFKRNFLQELGNGPSKDSFSEFWIIAIHKSQ